jgi:aromatic ring-opening dioxygenase catalytic subunit (LigB family)
LGNVSKENKNPLHRTRETIMKLPTFFIPHGGGPCFFMDWAMGPPDTWERLAQWLRDFNGALPAQPQALLVVSAHWEESQPTVMTDAQPPLLFDYYGFPPHTYELEWPAPGAPELAERVIGLLGLAGIATEKNPQRGFDHGVFVPLLLSYPNAWVPTLQLSLRTDLEPEAHLAMGRALAPLREEGVLIVGSGNSYHNMQSFGQPEALPDSRRFDSWMGETVALPPAERDAALIDWSAAPAARACHPREEHLLPLMVAAGAAGDSPGKIDFQDVMMGALISAIRFG